MGSVFRKVIHQRVPAGATRKPAKDGGTTISWTDRQRRRCSGKLVTGNDGLERVSYRAPEYHVRYRDEHGKLRTQRSHTTDKELARSLLKKKEQEVLELELDPTRTRRAAATRLASQSLDELIDLYLQSLRESHRASTKSYLRRLVPYFGWRRFGCVQLRQLEQLRDQLLVCRAQNQSCRLSLLKGGQVPTLRTIRGIVIAAKGLCTWVASAHGVPNPLSALRAPRAKKAERRPRRAFTVEEIARLIRAAEADRRDLHGCATSGVLGQQAALIYLLISRTAVRPASIRRLRIRDVLLHGAGGVLVVTPKVTDAEIQRIPFGPELADALRRWIEVRRADAGFGPDAPLVRWPARQRQQFLKHLEDAGIARVVLGHHVDLYALRASWNTHAFHADVPAELRARVMGHSSTKLVQDRYLLLDEIATSEAIEQVDRRLSRGEERDAGRAASQSSSSSRIDAA
jgi:integrase